MINLTEAGSGRFYIILAIIFFRYLILASIEFIIFYYAKKSAWSFKKIQKKFPDCKIKIVVECPLYDEQQVRDLFPIDRFETQFTTIKDFHKSQQEIREMKAEADFILGISVLETEHF